MTPTDIPDYPAVDARPQDPPARGWRGTPEIWLKAAHGLLIEAGVDAVKVAPLAARLGLSRTSFYHHFTDREALLEALLARWEGNSRSLIGRAGAYAETLPEAMLNVFDCWLDPTLFDAAMDFAVRNWALSAPEVSLRMRGADAARLAALSSLFARFGCLPAEADTRARTVYLTQVGYISIGSQETLDERLERVPGYVETFTGRAPSQNEIARFRARHGVFKQADDVHNGFSPKP